LTTKKQPPLRLAGQCAGRTVRGRCQRPATEGQWCTAHNPKHAARRHEFAVKAAHAARPRLALAALPERCPPSLNRMPAFIAGLVDAVLLGKLDPRVANAAGYLIQTCMRAAEFSDIVEQLDEIRKQIGEREETG